MVCTEKYISDRILFNRLNKGKLSFCNLDKMLIPALTVNGFKISNRHAVDKDLETLDEIYTQNMRDYVELNYQWQPTLFRYNFKSCRYTVLHYKETIIGFLCLLPKDNSLYIGEIQIAAQHQNQGIGTKILQTIIKQSKEQYRELNLQVLRGNPAIKLYQRMGFTIHQETATHYQLRLSV